MIIPSALISADWGERIRTLVQAIIILITSYLAPLSKAFTVLVIMAVADVFGGVAGNVWTGREEFKFRKAWQAIYKIITYCVLVLLVHIVVSTFDDAGALGPAIIKFLTWTISYWYLNNILGNACKVFPHSRGILFLYLLLSLKVLPMTLRHFGISKEDSDDLNRMIAKVREGDDPVTKVIKEEETTTKTTTTIKADKDNDDDSERVEKQ